MTRVHQIFPGMVQQTQGICHDCRGEGEKIRGVCNILEGQSIDIINSTD